MTILKSKIRIGRAVPEDPALRYAKMITQFMALRPKYEQLAMEVAYILKLRMDKQTLKYASIIYRTKELESFLNKLSRKSYTDPFNEMMDIAGVRLIYVYPRDYMNIKDIINEEFVTLETVDKVKQMDSDKFGYGAIHHIVKLGNRSSGARYDELKELVCEIQVRTVLQDAWAIVNHHMIYKKEEEVPSSFRRKINSLAGLFETADNQLDALRQERDNYLERITQTGSEEWLMSLEINMDTTLAFLQSYHNEMSVDISTDHLSWVLRDINRKKYRSIRDLADLLDRCSAALQEYEKENGYKLQPSGKLAIALALDDLDYRHTDDWDSSETKAIESVEHLVRKRS